MNHKKFTEDERELNALSSDASRAFKHWWDEYGHDLTGLNPYSATWHAFRAGMQIQSGKGPMTDVAAKLNWRIFKRIMERGEPTQQIMLALLDEYILLEDRVSKLEAGKGEEARS